jgi:hypothetical protein
LDGSVFLWNLNDGRCLNYGQYVLSFPPTKILGASNENNIVCCGKNSELEVLDYNQMRVVRKLEGKEWIKDICFEKFEVEGIYYIFYEK